MSASPSIATKSRTWREVAEGPPRDIAHTLAASLIGQSTVSRSAPAAHLGRYASQPLRSRVNN